MRNPFKRKTIPDDTSHPIYSAVGTPPPPDVDPIRWYWEKYVALRDGLPGICQITQTGMNLIASMVGAILDDPTTHCTVYADTPHMPSTYSIRGNKAGDIEVREWKNGITFEYGGQICMCVYPDNPCGQVCSPTCAQIGDCLRGTR